jgi:hypothetical protein
MGCAPSRSAPRDEPHQHHPTVLYKDLSTYDAYYGNFPEAYPIHPVSKSHYRQPKDGHSDCPPPRGNRYDVSPPRNHRETPRRHSSQYAHRDVSPVREAHYESPLERASRYGMKADFGVVESVSGRSLAGKR